MTITFRDAIGAYPGKGSKLTKGEIDTNFYELLLRIIDLESGGAFGLDSVEYNGSSITFNWSDSTSSGPFFLPVATFRARGLWTNDQVLLYLDVVTVPGVGTFLVQIAHTTPSAPEEFDPAAENDSGELLYLLIGEAPDMTDVMKYRGDFAGGEAYFEDDVFTSPDYGLFLVTAQHGADPTLDPLAEVDSVPLYKHLAAAPFAPIESVTDSTYEITSADAGKFLVFEQGCVINIPELTMPPHAEVHVRQGGDEEVLFTSDDMAVDIRPQRDGYDTATPWKGATVTIKWASSTLVYLIGPHGDEVTS